MADGEPLYSCEAPSVGIARRYSVYPDRIELELKLLDESIVISTADIRSVIRVGGGVRELLTGTLSGRYPAMALLWGLMLDNGFRRPHLLLHTASGPVRYYRFCPQNPDAFVAACGRMQTDGPGAG